MGPTQRRPVEPGDTKDVDVFVSHVSDDAPWATWVAAVLEQRGLSARVLAWDLPPGVNYVLWTDAQMAAARLTMVISSAAYFDTPWSSQVWTGALVSRSVIPLRVEACPLPGMLATIAHVDLFDADETEARRRVLVAAGVETVARVATRGFPTDRSTVGIEPTTFPGAPPPSEVGSSATEVGSSAAEVGSPTAEVGSPTAEVGASPTDTPPVSADAPPSRSSGADAARLRRRLPRAGLALLTTRALMVTVGVAIVVAGAVAGLLMIRGNSDGVPSARMVSDLRVAVTAFDEVDDAGQRHPSASTTDAATLVADQMVRSLQPVQQSLAVQVWGPSKIGRAPSGRGDQAGWADQIVHRSNANIVVRGVLRPAGADRVVFTPEFFIDRSLVPGAEELAGYYQFGTPVAAPAGLADNPVFQREIRTVLAARAGALAWFVLGVGHYALGHYDEAAADLRKAAGMPGWQDADGKEILYLFLGNAADKKGRYDEAIGWFGKATGINPRFGRAHTGAAEARFHLSRGQCTTDTVKVTDLRQSIDVYLLAAGEVAPPYERLTRSKIDLGLGRVYACLSQAAVSADWDAARRHFRLAIDEGTGDPAGRTVQSEAWVGLALVELPPRGVADPAAYRRAVDAYRNAVALADGSTRSAQLLSLLGHVQYISGDRAGAQKSFDQAAQLDPTNRARYLAEFANLSSPAPSAPAPQA
ncbi:toll/interleukin-1 receptor domain-containing protein [Frankia sp. AvcI1]|uniref:toll/interleukin-1 receptor domain-containing protein n=1 Tax=Frankia sp. AvcI1 TaxID=573496 RepID=UPI00211907A0|nr:toll/interleukin-1 receptor domain-containing protein [Frankia sp. AvcI1]